MKLPRQVVGAAIAPYFATVLSPVTPWQLQRLALEAAARIQPQPRGTQVIHVKRGGRDTERVTVGANERPRAVVYLHGGGYTSGSPRVYRSLSAHLARAAGAVVFAVDYRLAPEHPYPAAIDDAVAAVLEICKEFPPDRVAICGDSAGGGLAVATARCLVDYHGVRVGALGLISPWVDLTDYDRPARDLVINTDWSKACMRAYAGDADPATPGLSPALGDLTGLPPMVVQVATSESLNEQVRRFAQKVRLAGGTAKLTELAGLWHSAHGMAGLVQEAADAVDVLGAALRAHLD